MVLLQFFLSVTLRLQTLRYHCKRSFMVLCWCFHYVPPFIFKTSLTASRCINCPVPQYSRAARVAAVRRVCLILGSDKNLRVSLMLVSMKAFTSSGSNSHSVSMCHMAFRRSSSSPLRSGSVPNTASSPYRCVRILRLECFDLILWNESRHPVHSRSDLSRSRHAVLIEDFYGRRAHTFDITIEILLTSVVNLTDSTCHQLDISPDDILSLFG